MPRGADDVRLGYRFPDHRVDAAVLGFGGVAGTAIAAAKIVFVVALVAFAISGILSLTGRTC
jgi:uncharacterized membrane protein YtjA (UPF0391 family)